MQHMFLWFLWNTFDFFGDKIAHCSLCCSDFSISLGGKHDVTVHVSGKNHKEAASAASSSQSVTSSVTAECDRG